LSIADKSKSQKHNQQRKWIEQKVIPQQANKTALHKSATIPTIVPAWFRKQSSIKATLLQKLFGTKQAPQTAQESIPFREIYKDGICRVNDRLFTKTITFDDINYQLAQNEDKTLIFDGYCNFLNYFDSAITVQLSFINKYGNTHDFEKTISIPDQDDDFNSVRTEYAEMLKNQNS